MRLWAVVIGSKKINRRYVAFEPGFVQRLAVRKDRGSALDIKKELLKTCGHKDVYVIPFESK